MPPIVPTLERARERERKARARLVRQEIREIGRLSIVSAHWLERNARTCITWAVAIALVWMMVRAFG